MEWLILVDMLAIAEQWHRTHGRYPTQDDIVAMIMARGFRWGGDNLFFCDFDATEGMYHGEIIASISLAKVKKQT